MTSVSSALATGDDWAAAVDAAQAVDPTITAPTTLDTDISAVGGGHVLPGASSLDFAFSASRRSGEVRGQLTEIVGFGQPFQADVVCIAHGVLPDGTKVARLVGALREPAFGTSPTLVFDVTDSGLPGGEGDTWSGSFSPLDPLSFPCVPGVGGGEPIANGNISIR